MITIADSAKVASGEIREHKTARLCRDCKHWGKNDDTGVYRPCLAIVHDRRRHTSACFDPGHQWGDGIHPTEDRLRAAQEFRGQHVAVVCDHEDFRAEMRTRGDFGCTLFEARA